MKRILFLALVLLTLVPVACDFGPELAAPAPGELQFTVAAGQKYTVAVPLREGGTVQGTLSVSGPENFIDFYVRGPNGELSFGVVRVAGGQSFEMKAEADGTYTLVFDNSFSFGSSRQVSLNYRTR
ncbi:MAG: emp24/gp25L/p24 family protein [Chloroflexi bacterium]|nr:emp24/gp25L/p24 family protein [Chloroflexota bacterium]